jgi:hypothetical protein
MVKLAGLAQQNDFGPTFVHSLLSLVKGTAKRNSAGDWLDSLIGSCALLVVLCRLLAAPVLVLWVGLEKSK